MNLSDVPLQQQRITEEEMRVAMDEVFGKDYASDFRDPVLFRRTMLQSPAPIQFYKREFPLISRTLHLEMVYRRRFDFNQDLLDRFSALSSRKLEDILKMLSLQHDRLEKLCSQNGAEERAHFLHPIVKVVPIIAPGAGGYIAVLEKLDAVYALTGFMTLAGLIDTNQRKQAELQCRKAVRAYSAMVRIESIRLRKEHQRLRAGGDAVIGEDESRAEAAHDEATSEYDKSVGAENQELGLAAEGAASQVISDLSATAAASAAPARKPSRARAKDAATTGSGAGEASAPPAPAPAEAGAAAS